MPIRYPRRAGLVLATGQTTQYSSELDDGYYEKGLAKAYSVLTASQYAGTTNIDLAHYAGTAGQVAFVAATKKITDVGNGLAIFKTGDTIICSGPAEANNIAVLTVATGNVAGEIVVTESLTNETPAGVVTIKKREAHSNACVLDMNSGLMWSRTVSDKMGSSSSGTMPWTGFLYDIFAYATAANTAGLAGYSDWQVPNINELLGLFLSQIATPRIDAAFAGFNTDITHSSTTNPANTTKTIALYWTMGTGNLTYNAAKDNSEPWAVLLVRGG